MQFIDPVDGQPYFGKRRHRYNDDRHPRELTFSCYRGFRFLERERTRTWFLEALAAARTKFRWDLWAYVIMPEHVHLLVYPPEPEADIRHFLRAIKEPVARSAIAFLRSQAPKWLDKITVHEGTRVRHRFWQPGGGYDRNVTDLSTLRYMIEYIHANPVRRGLAKQPEDWEWSSARWFCGIRPVKIEMDVSVIEELARGS
jgi:putative transposase